MSNKVTQTKSMILTLDNHAFIIFEHILIKYQIDLLSKISILFIRGSTLILRLLLLRKAHQAQKGDR